MGKLSPSTAASAWNISRTVVYERMKRGDLSYTKSPSGKRQIDSAEMLRVFGEPNEKNNTSVLNIANPAVSLDSSSLIAALNNQIRILKEQTETLSDQLKVKDEQLSQRDNQVQALIDQLSEVNNRLLYPPDEEGMECADLEQVSKSERRWWRLSRMT